jgi:hypothetical protein
LIDEAYMGLTDALAHVQATDKKVGAVWAVSRAAV